MRRSFVLALTGALMILAAVPAGAGTKTVDMQNSAGAYGSSYSFNPSTVTVALGSSVQWTNTGTTIHTSTQNNGLWNTGDVAPNTSATAVAVSWAGSFSYHCRYHGVYGMKGTVKTPLNVAPSSGSTATTFTITVATAAPPSGFVFDMQMRKGSGPWTTFKQAVTSRRVAFHASASGAYSFRSRVSKTSGGQSGWSPLRTITVS